MLLTYYTVNSFRSIAVS